MRIKSNKVILLLLVVVILGAVAVSGCMQQGAQPRGWSGGTLSADILFLGSMEGKLVALNTSSNVRVWQVPLETSRPAGGFGCASSAPMVAIYGNPIIDQDLVYTGGYNGKIYAFNSSSGALRWVYPREGNLQPIVGGPAVASGKLYFASAGGKVYALDAATGDKQWESETGDKVWSTPVVDGDTLYIGSFDRKLYAINVKDGSKKWQYETQGAIVSTVLVYNSTVYVGSFDRYLYALNGADGSLKWKSGFDAGNWFWARPVAFNNMVYAPCLDGKVYVLNAETGGKVTELNLGSPVSSSPVLAGSSVIVASEEGKVYAIDTRSHDMRLLANLDARVDAPLAHGEGVVYVHAAKDALFGVNTETGAIRKFHIN